MGIVVDYSKFPIYTSDLTEDCKKRLAEAYDVKTLEEVGIGNDSEIATLNVVTYSKELYDIMVEEINKRDENV